MFQKFFRCSPKPSAPILALTDPHWAATLHAFREQLAVTQPTDPLWAGVLGLLDANLRVELNPVATPGLSSEEAHRFRGRIGMLLDLKAEMEKLHREARAEPPGVRLARDEAG